MPWSADGMKVGGDVFLDEGFTAAGRDRAGRCGHHRPAQLQRRPADRPDSDGDALSADGMKVGGDVFLDKGFTAAGAVRLAGADITGQLNCRGAQLTGRDNDGNALAADGMKVGGECVPRRRVHRGGGGPAGRRGHHRPAQLPRRPADRHDNDGNALVADGMKVGGDVFLDGGFTAAGAVRLPGADITGPAQLPRRPADRHATTTATPWPPTG